MSQLVVRRLEEDVKLKLRRRAARHGCSMEAEVRDILRDAVKGDNEPEGEVGLGTLARRRFAGLAFEKEVLESLPRTPIKPPRFDE